MQMALFLVPANSFGHKASSPSGVLAFVIYQGGTAVKIKERSISLCKTHARTAYYTLFSSYPMLLDYHEEQAKNSRWIRCKVADLQVEPLGKSSPLIGNLPAFAAGTSQEAVDDTAENLGLAMRVNGELYPVRMTAYKSLLDRAKIGGTALPKLSREVLAEVLNECLKLYSADALC